MDRIIQDVRFGLKLLWKDKAFSATVLLTLGICIGANATIFSVINTVLLKPLPYEEPDQLVTLYNVYPRAAAGRGSNGGPDFFFRREGIDGLEEVANYQGWANTVGEAGSTERARSIRVTSTFFDLLRVQPILLPPTGRQKDSGKKTGFCGDKAAVVIVGTLQGGIK